MIAYRCDMSEAALVMSIIALAIAVIAMGFGIVARRQLATALTNRPSAAPRHPVPLIEATGLPQERGPAALVINPIKVSNPERLEELARTLSRELDLPEPLIFRTSVEDPGSGQARSAIAAGASVVIAAGGDGTVRAVATALAGTSTPMALVPSGTGNLLARNLDIPVDGLHAQVLTALSGRDMPIDLGWVTAFPRRRRPARSNAGESPETPPEHVFLVMAGLGFDAAMVAGADDALKKRMGWVAYFFAGVRHLHSRKTRVAMQVGTGSWQQLRVRTLLFANCGRLPAGIVLLPDAEIDDGYLDIAAIDTRGGLIGWASLLWRVLLQGIGVQGNIGYQPSSIQFSRGRVIAVKLDEPENVQVDGDLIGEAEEIHVRVQADGLRVRVRR